MDELYTLKKKTEIGSYAKEENEHVMYVVDNSLTRCNQVPAQAWADSDFNWACSICTA